MLLLIVGEMFFNVKQKTEIVLLMNLTNVPSVYKLNDVELVRYLVFSLVRIRLLDVENVWVIFLDLLCLQIVHLNITFYSIHFHSQPLNVSKLSNAKKRDQSISSHLTNLASEKLFLVCYLKKPRLFSVNSQLNNGKLNGMYK